MLTIAVFASCGCRSLIAPDENALFSGQLPNWGLNGIRQPPTIDKSENDNDGMDAGVKDLKTMTAEYFTGFGPAETPVRKYFDAWNANCQKAERKNINATFANLPQIMPVEELNKIGGILHQAAAKHELTYGQKEQLDQLLAGHEHTMTMLTVNNMLASAETPKQFNHALKSVEQLVQLRKIMNGTLNVDFKKLAAAEKDALDICGVELLKITDGLQCSSIVKGWRLSDTTTEAHDQQAASISMTARIEAPVPARFRGRVRLAIWGIAPETSVFFNRTRLEPNDKNAAGSAVFAIAESAFDSTAADQTLKISFSPASPVRPCRKAIFMH